MVFLHNQRRSYNPVLLYALNVFVLHCIRVYDKPASTWSTLAFASSSSSDKDYTVQGPRKRFLSFSRSFSNNPKDDGGVKNNSPENSSSSKSLLDRLDDFQLSNLMIDLQKKFQSDELLQLVRTSSQYNCLGCGHARWGDENSRTYRVTALDRFAKCFSLYSGYFVAFQLIVSILSFNDNALIKEVRHIFVG